MEDVKIYVNNIGDNTIQSGSTVVTLNGILRLRKGSELVGELDAQIDFKDLSPEYHQKALNMLLRMGHELYLPVDEPKAQETKVENLEEEFPESSFGFIDYFKELYWIIGLILFGICVGYYLGLISY